MEDLQKVTYFAETDSRGERKPFGIKNGDRSKHVYVIGKTGMGKSTLLENMAIQDIQSGNGLCFIDPHGGTAEKLLEYVPEERVKDVLYMAPFDIDYPVAFNVMEDVGAEKRHLVASGLMSAFMKLFGEESFSDRMQYILQNTILALLEYPGSTMLGINKMLADKAYRKKVVDNITDPSVKAYWTQEYAGYTERFAAEAIPAIQNKIGQFTSNPLIRNIIGQPKSSFNFRTVMDEKKIVIVNLSKGRVGEGNARLLGSMLITKIYLAAMSRADESATSLAKLSQFYLFVDEFQSFADKSFADILSEARKYKLNLTIAHQYIEQMDEEVRDAVFGNVGTTIAFRVGAYDADVLEKEFAPVFIAEDLVNLGRFQIYLKLMIDSVSSPPFSASALPPIQPLRSTYTKEIVENSRRVFAKTRSDIEKSIVEWHAEGKDEMPTPAPKSKMTPYVPKKPQAIDTRSLAKEAPAKREEFQRSDLKSDSQGQTLKPASPPPVPKKQEVSPKVSLESLKNKNNNQRKPDEKHVSALRDALKSVGAQPTINNKQETSPEPKLTANSSQLKAGSGPSPEDLKKIFNG
ncbi:MAG: type IV secretion system DNA-binding domain-containing protein [Candidatus Zambryskibacteria bacterium]|nr:type IV secretion system DNA-binding domain-containing protein [Candidatus Zambryskibacteria bacterium]